MIETTHNPVALKMALCAQVERLVPAHRIQLTPFTADHGAHETVGPDGKADDCGGVLASSPDGGSGPLIVDVPLRCGSHLRGWIRIPRGLAACLPRARKRYDA